MENFKNRVALKGPMLKKENIADCIDDNNSIKTKQSLNVHAGYKNNDGGEESKTEKKISKAKKEKVYNEMRICNNFEDAMELKNSLLIENLVPDTKLYYELIYKCNKYSIIQEIVKEMRDNNCEFDERIYRLLIHKSINFEDAMFLVREMEKEGILPSIKIYHVLIKKSNTVNDTLNLYEKLKSSYIAPDIELINLIITKTKGNSFYYKFMHLKYVITSIEELATSIHNKETVLATMKSLENLDISIDIELLNILINHIQNADGIKVITDIAREYNLKCNVETYMYLLKKIISLDCLDRYYYILKELEAELDYREFEKLFQAYKSNSKYAGGMGKYLLQKERVIKNLNSNAKIEKDLFQQTYLLGIITGLEEANKEFNSIREDTKSKLDELKQDDDYELYQYDIKNTEGIVVGINEAQKMYEDIQSKQMAHKAIAFVSDESILESFSCIAISNFFYKANLSDINNYDINTFNFTSSIEEFYKIINTVDYNKYDVSVTIASNYYESRGFIEFYPEALPAINCLNEILVDRVCNVRFINMSDKSNISTNSIFTKMYKDNAMKRITNLA